MTSERCWDNPIQIPGGDSSIGRIADLFSVVRQPLVVHVLKTSQEDAEDAKLPVTRDYPAFGR